MLAPEVIQRKEMPFIRAAEYQAARGREQPSPRRRVKRGDDRFMRGDDQQQSGMFSYVSLEDRVNCTNRVARLMC